MGDEGKRPLWPGELADALGENKVLTADEIAASAGVSKQALAAALKQMAAAGQIHLMLVPVCNTCGDGMGAYPDPEALPDEVVCPHCGQCHHISELYVRVQYVAIRSD